MKMSEKYKGEFSGEGYVIEELRAKLREMEQVFRDSAEKSFTPPPPGADLVPVLQAKVEELEATIVQLMDVLRSSEADIEMGVPSCARLRIRTELSRQANKKRN